MNEAEKKEVQNDWDLGAVRSEEQNIQAPRVVDNFTECESCSA